MQDVQRYGRLVDEHALTLQARWPVEVSVVSDEVLQPVDVASWFGEAVAAASVVARDGRVRTVRYGANPLTVHPAGAAVTVLHDGPTVTGDAWIRIGRRLDDKIHQTAGGPPTWIRLEVDGTLFALTNLRSLDPAGRLDALARNTAAALADAPHVLGVLSAPRPGPAVGRPRP